MFSQHTYTIIVVTLDAIARVDLLSGNSVEVVQSSRVNRSPQAELGDAVRTGLGLGPKKCGRVYILSDDFWSGRVSLANEIVDAVTDDQLAQTLALEAEHESGISPFESHLGYVRDSSIDGQTTWWVTQAESVQLHAIAAAVPNWAKSVVGFSSTALATPSESTDKEPLDTTSSESCDALAQAWLNNYLSAEHELPVICLKSQPWTDKHRRKICLLTAVGALALCVVFHTHGTRQVAGANAELLKLVTLEKQLRVELDDSEALARQYQEVKHQQEAQARQLDEHRNRQIEYAANRKRPVQLLQGLAQYARLRITRHDNIVAPAMSARIFFNRISAKRCCDGNSLR